LWAQTFTIVGNAENVSVTNMIEEVELGLDYHNLGGLGVEKPVKLKWELEEEDEGLFWVDEGVCKDDFCIEREGLVAKTGCITFASRNIKEVQAFIDGIRAVGTLLHIPALSIEGE